MLKSILSLPLIVILMGLGAFSMLIPASHAAVVNDDVTMRAFFQSAILFLILAALLGLATANRKIRWRGRSYLLALLAAFAGLPMMLAVPFNLAVSDTSYLISYVQMVSDLTTSGAAIFDKQIGLPGSVHLWRSLVGWLGGLLILVAAVAILAPMKLGGYEVLSSTGGARTASESSQAEWAADGSERIRRSTAQIFPIYTGITLVLWAVLLVLGDTPLVSISHAMSALSTSGISPIGGAQFSNSGFAGEVVILIVLVGAITRQAFVVDQGGIGLFRVRRDVEFRLALILIFSAVLFLVIGYLFRASGSTNRGDLLTALGALWGALFTITSFLTTTGFESVAWGTAREWSGLNTPGIILMGLALLGGGVATTAGGVKLLRVYALYRHGAREMERLVHPSSVGGAGTAARQMRRRGATIAWVFFMLFALSAAFLVSLFGLAGMDFETSAILTAASLSTTGPLIDVVGQQPLEMAKLNDGVKLIFASAMVLGRLETLAIIALFNPEFWRQ